jgi:Ni,Fe-hydrogenase III small subunit
MSDISSQLIKDSYNYVLQSDLSTGVVYRIGGTIPVNPIFQSGLTVNSGFTYSNGTEGVGYALLTDGTGYAYWAPVSAATPSSGVTSVTATNGLSGNVTTGAVTIVNTAPDQTVTISGGTGITTGGTYPNFTIVNSAPDRTVTISGGTGITTGGTYPNFTLVNSAPDRTVTITGGTSIQITGTYPDFGVNYTGATIIQGITGITGTSGVSASTTDYVTTIINTAPDQTVTISGGTGITTGGTYPNFTLVNSEPDRTVTITGGTNIQITGTYPDFGVNFTGTTTGGTVSGDYLPLSGGTVTGVTIFQSGLTANTFYSSGQVGVGTSNPNAAAIIEIASTTQGVLFPRMTKVQRDLISTPTIGLMLFVTDDNEGLYIYKTSGWVQII